MLFKLVRVQYQNPAPARLLLLRVFALNKAGRVSFEKLQRHWQYAGPILMISGPDLAASTMDANELVDFVTNNLKKHFCETPSSIERNLQKIDMKADQDGSFRITEFFCRNSTWKDVLIKLVSMSNIVLMDLRNFSEMYKGCQYEIQQLVDYMSLAKVVVLINEQTNLDFLKATFNDAFRNMTDRSPNRDIPRQVQLYFFQPGRASNFSNLLKLLCNLSQKAEGALN